MRESRAAPMKNEVGTQPGERENKGPRSEPFKSFFVILSL